MRSKIQNIAKWTKIGFGHVIINFEEKLSGPKSDSQKFRLETCPSHENELFQTLFGTEEGTPA